MCLIGVEPSMFLQVSYAFHLGCTNMGLFTHIKNLWQCLNALHPDTTVHNLINKIVALFTYLQFTA